ncbi:MAG: cytochrome c nitrite reductase small subunit [Nitrospiraceae bacterium]|jgi:cytochrome c nitrite reductase small subunit|nr:MAG: cytochrome c nitrite reductase small subunit [Nitrospiraceae bacterium]
MADKGKRKFVLYAVVIIAGIALASIYFMLGPPKLLAKSNSPDFCGGCHVMEDEYEAWSHTGAHRRKKCVDCHLPNENAAVHYAWKAIDGLKDVAFFYSGRVPEQIKLTQHGEKVLQTNCVRCHENTVMLIDTERQCWKCHRRISHKRSGAMQTL